MPLATTGNTSELAQNLTDLPELRMGSLAPDGEVPSDAARNRSPRSSLCGVGRA